MEGEIRDQSDTANRSAVIAYDDANKFVYYARRWNKQASSYICQLPRRGLCEQTPAVALN